MSQTYKVWDDSGSAETAATIEAHSPSDAAEKHAADDVDGQADGVYANEGLEVFVMDDKGVVHKFHVTAEYEPTFYAVEMTLDPKPEPQ